MQTDRTGRPLGRTRGRWTGRQARFAHGRRQVDGPRNGRKWRVKLLRRCRTHSIRRTGEGIDELWAGRFFADPLRRATTLRRVTDGASADRDGRRPTGPRAREKNPAWITGGSSPGFETPVLGAGLTTSGSTRRPPRRDGAEKRDDRGGLRDLRAVHPSASDSGRAIGCRRRRRFILSSVGAQLAANPMFSDGLERMGLRRNPYCVFTAPQALFLGFLCSRPRRQSGPVLQTESRRRCWK